MAKTWKSVLVLAGWIGLASPLWAQTLPGAGMPFPNEPLPIQAMPPAGAGMPFPNEPLPIQAMPPAGQFVGAYPMPGVGCAEPTPLAPSTTPSLAGSSGMPGMAGASAAAVPPGDPSKLSPPPLEGNTGAQNAFKREDESYEPTSGVDFGFEYLLWSMKPNAIPALVTTGSATDAVPGALGQPGTSVLLGNSLSSGATSGVRFSARYWDAEYPWVGVEGNFFIMNQRSTTLGFSGDGSANSPVISRPFFDPNFNTENADPVALPDVQAGNVVVALTRRFMGGEVNLSFNRSSTAATSWRAYLLGGFRFLALDEKLSIQENVTDLPSGQFPNQNFNIADGFTTYNRFYGGQVGGEVELRLPPFTLSVLGKVAVGLTDQVVRTSGSTVITDQASGAVLASVSNEGLLVQPSNFGRFSANSFSVVPEVQFNLTCRLCERIRLLAGYNFLFWSDVARPGDQIDRTVSIQPLGAPAQIGPARPALTLNRSGFWAQGLNVGVEFNY